MEKFNAAWKGRDTATMSALLHPSNKIMRGEFERRAGVTLPKQVGKTRDAVRQYFAQNPVAEKAATPPPEPTGIEWKKAKIIPTRQGVVAVPIEEPSAGLQKPTGPSEKIDALEAKIRDLREQRDAADAVGDSETYGRLADEISKLGKQLKEAVDESFEFKPIVAPKAPEKMTRDELRAAIRNKLKNPGGTPGSGPAMMSLPRPKINFELLRMVQQFGQMVFVDDGITDLKGWTAKMVDELGEEARPYLPPTWDHVNMEFGDGTLSGSRDDGTRVADSPRTWTYCLWILKLCDLAASRTYIPDGLYRIDTFYVLLPAYWSS